MQEMAEKELRKFKTSLLGRTNLDCFLVEKIKLSIHRISEILMNYSVLYLGDTIKHKVLFQVVIWGEKKYFKN